MIPFRRPLEPATFLERPNRFLVLASTLSGAVVSVHCADPGRLREILIPGVRIYLAPAARPNRKTSHDLRLAQHPETGVLVSVNSRYANDLFLESLARGVLAPFGEPSRIEYEVPLPPGGSKVRSRADFRVTCSNGEVMWVEVKSVTLVRDGIAMFPDAVTERGARHVRELAELVRQGAHAAVCFVVQRPDAHALRPEWDRDPVFARALQDACGAGVRAYAWTANVTLSGAGIARQIPVYTDRPGSHAGRSPSA